MTGSRNSSARRAIWLTVIGVFLLGCVTGAALANVYRLRAISESARRPPNAGKHDRDKEERFQEMKNDLKLSDEQTTQIRVILDQTGNDYRMLRSEVSPRFDAIRQNSRAKIRALLAPDQQQRFDAVIKERDAKRDENENKPHS